MSETDNQQRPETVSPTHDVWSARLAQIDDAPVEEIKDHIESRGWLERNWAGLKKFDDLLVEQPGVAGTYFWQGFKDGTASTVGLMGDLVTSPWWLASVAGNEISHAFGGKGVSWEKPGFMSMAEGLREKVQTAPEIQQHLMVKNEEGEIEYIRNKYADSMAFSRSLGSASFDFSMVIATAGVGGAAIGATRGALAPLGVRTFQTAKNMARVGDAVEFLAKAEGMAGKLSRAAKMDKLLVRSDMIMSGDKARSFFESVPGFFSKSRGAIGTQANLDRYVAAKIGSTSPTGLRGLVAKVPGLQTRAQKIVKAEKAVAEAGEDAAKLAKAEAKLDKVTGKLDEINKLAERGGLVKYSAEDALKLGNTARTGEGLSRLEAAIESMKTGAYRGFRFTDPTYGFKGQAIIGGGMTGYDFYLYKQQVDMENTSAGQMGTAPTANTETMEDFKSLEAEFGLAQKGAAPSSNQDGITANTPAVRTEFSNMATGAKIPATPGVDITAKPLDEQQINDFLNSPLQPTQ